MGQQAISVASLGGQLGVTFLPIIVILLLGNIGWRHVWLLACFTILIFFLPLLFLSLHNQSIRSDNFSYSIKNIKSQKNTCQRTVNLPWTHMVTLSQDELDPREKMISA